MPGCRSNDPNGGSEHDCWVYPFIQELIDFGLVEPHSSGRGRKRRYAFKWHSIYERHQPQRSSTTIEAGPFVSVRNIIEEQFPDLSKKLL